MSKDIKGAMKKAAIRASIITATLGGTYTNTQAQEVNSSHTIEYAQSNAKKYTITDDNDFDIFNFAVKNSRNQSELKDLMKKHFEKMNNFYSEQSETYTISMSDYAKGLQEIGCSPLEVARAKSAFNEVIKMKEDANTFVMQPQVVNAPRAGTDSPVYSVDNGSISYHTEKGELKISGRISGNINHLLPNLYRNAEGEYQCGSSTGADKDFVMQEEISVIKDLVMGQKVYNDIQQRADKGGKLNTAEQSFVKSFPERLEEEGLNVDSKGNLVQQNPRYQANMMSSSLSR